MRIQNPTARYIRALFGIAAALLITAKAQASYESVVLGDQPLAFYALDLTVDNSGTATDLTTNGNNSLYYNAYPVAGPTPTIPNAAAFSPNVQSYVDLSTGTNTGVLQFTGPTTLEAWVQPADSTSFGDIIAKGYDASSYDEVALRVNGPYGANYFGYFGTGGVSGGQQNTNWNYVVLSNDGTNTSLYINASLIQKASDTNGSISFSDAWAIGNGTSAGNTRFFNGNICQAAIYSHGLTSSQVLTHFYYGEINASPSTSPPIIIAQPQPQATSVGGTAIFSVQVVSAFTTTNQWLKNGLPIAGQTGPTLTINNAQLTDASNYSVVIGNGVGTTNSVTVPLTLSAVILKWSGSGNSGVWDTSTTANWINESNNQQSVFDPGDQVLFDDTVGAPTSVTVSGSVAPSLITVNSSTNNFSIGSGTITGSAAFLKEGSSLLTVVCPGGFTGPVTIAGGVIYAGNNCFSAVSSITVTNNSTLDLAGGTLGGNKPVTISGTGFNGQGAIINSYSDYPSELITMTLAGDATVGETARWDLASGALITGAHNLTIDLSTDPGDSYYSQWNSITLGANVLGVVLTNRTSLGMSSMDSSCQNPATLFTVGNSGQMLFYNGGFNGSIHVLGGGVVYIYNPNVTFSGSNLIFEDNSSLQTYYNSGVNNMNSAVTFNGIAHLVIGDHSMVYTNVLGGPGGFVMDYYNNPMVLSASNTYTGPTIIGSSGNSPEIALTGNGSVSHSSLIFFGGGDPTVAHIDASGRSDQTLTLASGQTLAGIGGINGKLVVSAGATLSPAGTNTTIGITTGTNATGTIAANNSITLNGTTVIKLNGSGVNDLVASTAGITYGGTLSLVNVSGSPLTTGESFNIFSGTSYTGTFATITPARPGPGLAWDFSQLNTSGTVAVITAPTIASVTASGGNLVLTGSGGQNNGTFFVATSTNVAAPLAQWTPISTNSYDGSGNFNVTNSVVGGGPQRFYIIK